MEIGNENLINCEAFEDNLSDYLEGALDRAAHVATAAHALSCPLCHALLNDVKQSMAVCHELAEIDPQLTRLEARVLANTMPEAALSCDEFEGYLTDYLDGFLPAPVFHRWERHAVLCEECTDLPGSVVRSLAALVSFKLDELPVPDGMVERILQETIGTEQAITAKAPWSAQIAEWFRGLRWPITVPQLAPVALMLMFAFLFISQSVSADGSLKDVYSKSFQIAEQTYRQSADAFRGAGGESR